MSIEQLLRADAARWQASVPSGPVVLVDERRSRGVRVQAVAALASVACVLTAVGLLWSVGWDSTPTENHVAGSTSASPPPAHGEAAVVQVLDEIDLAAQRAGLRDVIFDKALGADHRSAILYLTAPLPPRFALTVDNLLARAGVPFRVVRLPYNQQDIANSFDAVRQAVSHGVTLFGMPSHDFSSYTIEVGQKLSPEHVAQLTALAQAAAPHLPVRVVSSPGLKAFPAAGKSRTPR